MSIISDLVELYCVSSGVRIASAINILFMIHVHDYHDDDDDPGYNDHDDDDPDYDDEWGGRY